MSARKLPTGWIVLGGSVLASFVWWVATRPVRPAEPPPASVTAPAVEVAPPAAAPPAPVAPPRERPVKEAPAVAATPSPPSPAPPPPAAGPLLRVRGDIDGADVFIDRTFAGKTPLETRAVRAGSHQINISAEGFDGESRQVEVSATSPTDVVFALKAVALDTAVSVVHKHRLGSCQGRLIADVTGLRYAPTSGDDAFRAPLAGVETFSVDYQDKELRLKLKGGRTYIFTTRAANADPLFVFHRDVDKARTKLAGGK